MPAWMTSELRELVWVPIASSASRITTSRPAMARARATARPTAPAPITTASSLSMKAKPMEAESGDSCERGSARHRPGRAVEQDAEQGAHQRAAGEADGAHERARAPRGGGERGERR